MFLQNFDLISKMSICRSCSGVDQVILGLHKQLSSHFITHKFQPKHQIIRFICLLLMTIISPSPVSYGSRLSALPRALLQQLVEKRTGASRRSDIIPWLEKEMFICGISLMKHAVLGAGSALAKQQRFNLSPRCWRCMAGRAYPRVRMLLTTEANHNTC